MLRWVKGLPLSFACVYVLATQCLASPLMDIRAERPLSADTDWQFSFSVTDCPAIAEVQLVAQPAISLQPVHEDAAGLRCAYRFSWSNANNQPTVNVIWKDGTSQHYSEQFSAETNSPRLQIVQVAIENDATQQLVVRLTAEDDSDIAFVAVDVAGITASSLRQAGGVLGLAKNSAFASSQGVQRLYPQANQQQEFEIRLPLSANLSVEQVARDGLVLIDAYAMDAFGNRAALSSIEYTGDQVSETPLSWRVFPEQLVINDVLQSITILPYINYEFRGETLVGGAGVGVSYSSSLPEKVKVTADGVVYVSSDVGNVQADITVQYYGLPMLTVPVTVDLTKRLLGLKFDTGSEGITLASLNKAYTLPPLLAQFDDGSTAALGDRYPVKLTLPQTARGILQLQADSLTALHPVSSAAPFTLNAELAANAQIRGEVAVSARDAVPELQLKVPAKIEVNSRLVPEIVALDDVGIHKVEVFLNELSIAQLYQAPYQVTIPVSQDMLGQSLKFSAIATDSAGQRSVMARAEAQVVLPEAAPIPGYQFEFPTENQRLVEQSPMRYQLAIPLGPIRTADVNTGIVRVEYFMDGNKVGEAARPTFDIRDVATGPGKTEEHMFQLWQLDDQVPLSSLQLTSRAVFARIHMSNNQGDSATRLIRIQQNQPPTLVLQTPQQDQDVVAGQPVNVVLTVSDDTLLTGTQISARFNNREVFTKRIQDPVAIEQSATSIAAQQVSFALNIPLELLGSVQTLQVIATDFHGREAQTEPVRLKIKTDQPPTTAITQPVAGSSWVAGLPIEIMAAAADDIAVKSVEFYVNGQKQGTAVVPPYRYVYQSPQLQGSAQPLRLHVIATDGAGQQAQSQTVEVTLSQDEQPPVTQFVSPAVNQRQGELAVSEVIEGKQIALKVSGYDNVIVPNAVLSLHASS